MTLKQIQFAIGINGTDKGFRSVNSMSEAQDIWEEARKEAIDGNENH